MRKHYVYILANKKRGVTYIGTTRNLVGRVIYHRLNINTKSFTTRYKVYKLVYYEEYQTVMEAVEREKRLKRWKRSWKVRMIEELNPAWHDLLEGDRFLPSQE